MQTYEDLQVWKRSHGLVLKIYEATKQFPFDERFGLTSQIRRAVVSIAANLAEGCKRSTSSDFARHVAIARGSAGEVDYFVFLAVELGYLEEQGAQLLRHELDGIQRQLTRLWKSLTHENRAQ